MRQLSQIFLAFALVLSTAAFLICLVIWTGLILATLECRVEWEVAINSIEMTKDDMAAKMDMMKNTRCYKILRHHPPCFVGLFLAFVVLWCAIRCMIWERICLQILICMNVRPPRQMVLQIVINILFAAIMFGIGLLYGLHAELSDHHLANYFSKNYDIWGTLFSISILWGFDTLTTIILVGYLFSL